jgi:hypothetical protein
VLFYRWSTDSERLATTAALTKWIQEVPTLTYINLADQYLRSTRLTVDSSDSLAFEGDAHDMIERARTSEQLNAARGVRDATGNLYLHAARAGLTLLTDPRPDSPALKLHRKLLTLCAEPERLRDP